jgi:inhibitor of cysteine peptidase
MLEISQAMNGGQVEVAAGSEFIIQLRENPTTGYRWHIQEMNESAFEVIDDDFRPASGAVGAGGRRRWLIRAKHPGDFRVAIENKRSWEPRGVETFAVSLRVQPEASARSGQA